ncbi:hypothetical protein TYRP_005487 [Tyrophagus putrescentiae]|nr:hypothetical protein TYRP_005487 [Tyrophagus putrescentiae]
MLQHFDLLITEEIAHLSNKIISLNLAVKEVYKWLVHVNSASTGSNGGGNTSSVASQRHFLGELVLAGQRCSPLFAVGVVKNSGLKLLGSNKIISLNLAVKEVYKWLVHVNSASTGSNGGGNTSSVASQRHFLGELVLAG